MEILSDTLERLPDGTLEARGNVEAYYRQYYIRADYLRYNPETKEVFAEGNVYVRSTDGRLEAKGRSAFLNLKEDTGYFQDANGRFERFYISAKEVTKEKDVYRAKDGSVTTCPPQKKEMSLCFSKARIDDRYVFSTNNTLRLFRIPVAYLPLAFFPVGDRRSGLLPPVVGSNTYNTFIYQQPIYWAISRDKDATLTLDLRDKQAKGLSLEYRQAVEASRKLELSLSFYKEPTPPQKWWEGRPLSTFRENRYRLRFSFLWDDIKGGIDTVSDPYFLQDVYLHTKERTVPYLSSYINYMKDTDRWFFSFDVRHFYDTTSPNNSKTLQRLPEVSFYLKDSPLVGKLSYNALFMYTNFYRKEGPKTGRFVFFPQLSLSTSVLSVPTYWSLTWENIFYTKGEDVSTLRFQGRVPFVRDFVVGSWRSYNLLEVSYLYRPRSYNNPRIDPIDEVNKENQAGFLWRSSNSFGGREFLSLQLQTAYNFLGEYTYLGQKVKRNLLPVRGVVSLKPLPSLTFYTDTLYDVEGGNILTSSSNLQWVKGSSSLSVGYLTTRDVLGKRLGEQINYTFTTTFRDTTVRLYTLHDMRLNKDLLRQLNVDYRGACWGIGFMVRDFYDGNRARYIKEFFLVFNIFDFQRFTLPLKR